MPLDFSLLFSQSQFVSWTVGLVISVQELIKLQLFRCQGCCNEEVVMKHNCQKRPFTESQNGRGWKGPLWVI